MASISGVRSRIAGLKRRTRFDPSRRAAYGLAAQIETLLDDIDNLDCEPCAVVELLAAFFETDQGVFETCDDSDGAAGHEYTIHAAELFADRAARCDRKLWMGDLVFRLIVDDDYGVRGSLLDRVGSFLPEPQLRTLAMRLEGRARDGDRYASLLLSQAATCARQIPDPALFERLLLESTRGGHAEASLAIASCWLSSGDTARALAWHDRVPDDGFIGSRRDELDLEIRRALGDRDGMERVALRIASRTPRQETIEKAVDVLGEGRRSEIVARVVRAVLERAAFSTSEVLLLLETGHRAEAARHTIAHAADIYGGDYYSLPPLAERFVTEGEPLAATVIFRALLADLLDRKAYKAYGHGARHLRRLDALAEEIRDWGPIEPHSVFEAHIRREHRLKTSFWAKYENPPRERKRTYR
jgi:hypothetical protein